jgi:transcriptional regulator with XRE-family HTH domain
LHPQLPFEHGHPRAFLHQAVKPSEGTSGNEVFSTAANFHSRAVRSRAGSFAKNGTPSITLVPVTSPLLARLRRAAGYSQRDLAAETGISQRMIAYYEKETEYPPTHLLPLLTKALRISADQLLGLEKANDIGRKRDNRLWRRFSQVEKLAPVLRKQIVQILDAFLEREKFKKAQQ